MKNEIERQHANPRKLIEQLGQFEEELEIENKEKGEKIKFYLSIGLVILITVIVSLS